jgi:2-C-methyl-D-erythritol 4-phosphate cytidylyltransferase/2-C-methyl-D-erythritol 2,4-cyclodiphosphate synthase
MPRIGAVLVAAGSSTRAGGELPKQFRLLGVRPMFVLALEALLPISDEVVVVAPRDEIERAEHLVLESGARCRAGARPRVVPGGARRQDSVGAGLAALSEGVEIVLVHDAARPFASADLAGRVAAAALAHGAAVPVVEMSDTVKRVEDGRVVATLDRSVLGAAQTPQGFRRDAIERALQRAAGVDVTDDAQAVELAGGAVAVVAGEPGNTKITTSFDLELAALRLNGELGLDGPARAGVGVDCHRLVEGRRLVLCGVEVPFEKGLEGYSDADVASHALVDALLGAVAAGDIGRHFPAGDPQYEGISSLLLLERAAEIVRSGGFSIGNVDVTIIAERPRLSEFIGAMRRSIAGALAVDPEAVSVKATTTEGTGPEGEGLAVTARAVAVVRRVEPDRGRDQRRGGA